MNFLKNLIKVANKKTFSQDDHWNLRHQESSEGVTTSLSSAFYKIQHKKFPLIRSIYSTNQGIFWGIIFFSLMCALLEYTGPFLINHIIDYITDPNRTIQTGVLIVLGIVFARVLLSIFLARMRTLLVNKSFLFDYLIIIKGSLGCKIS